MVSRATTSTGGGSNGSPRHPGGTPLQSYSAPCRGDPDARRGRSEEHTSELQSHHELVCRLLLEKKKHEMTFDLPPEGMSLEHHLEAVHKICVLEALERGGGGQTESAALRRVWFVYFSCYEHMFE